MPSDFMKSLSCIDEYGWLYFAHFHPLHINLLNDIHLFTWVKSGFLNFHVNGISVSHALPCKHSEISVVHSSNDNNTQHLYATRKKCEMMEFFWNFIKNLVFNIKFHRNYVGKCYFIYYQLLTIKFIYWVWRMFRSMESWD